MGGASSSGTQNRCCRDMKDDGRCNNRALTLFACAKRRQIHFGIDNELGSLQPSLPWWHGPHSALVHRLFFARDQLGQDGGAV